jgi:hypothetical protein
MKVYVASSWRNAVQPRVIAALDVYTQLEVYDFRAPQGNGARGFHWSEIDTGWKAWRADHFRGALKHELAEKGFESDMEALKFADATLLVLPCGRSAHLELGYAVAAGQATAIYIPEDKLYGTVEPELMYKMVGRILISMDEVMNWGRIMGIEGRLPDAKT